MVDTYGKGNLNRIKIMDDLKQARMRQYRKYGETHFLDWNDQLRNDLEIKGIFTYEADRDGETVLVTRCEAAMDLAGNQWNGIEFVKS